MCFWNVSGMFEVTVPVLFLPALLVAALFVGESSGTGDDAADSSLSLLLLESFVEPRRCFLGVGSVDDEALFVAVVVAPFFFGGML